MMMPNASPAASTACAAASTPAPRPQTGEPVLITKGLAVGHGRRALVSDIDLVVRPGEVVALIGPNGSGKTTLLRTIAGQLAPRAGTVRIAGRDAGAIPAAELARTRAALFTERPSTELLSCRDIVEAGRYPFTGRLGILGEGDRARVREAMEATGTWELRDRDFGHMSDGQRQRALIARALCQEPRLLLLDEPTSYLDIRSQVDMLQLLRNRAQETGMAVVASLHEIDLAQKAADRIVCIRDGRVMQQGAPDKIFTRANMTALFDLDERGYEPLFGSVELAAAPGEPRVFVVAGGGTGAVCFRELQRRGIPFATGVLAEHDADGVLARSLAARAITVPDYEPVSDDALARARAALDGCRALVCCVDGFHTGDARNAELIEHARKRGIAVIPWRELARGAAGLPDA